jgi:hypothetical protein
MLHPITACWHLACTAYVSHSNNVCTSFGSNLHLGHIIRDLDSANFSPLNYHIAHQFHNSAFTVGSDRAVTFQTGDIYGHSSNQRLVWKGCKEDYIQVGPIFIGS